MPVDVGTIQATLTLRDQTTAVAAGVIRALGNVEGAMASMAKATAAANADAKLFDQTVKDAQRTIDKGIGQVMAIEMGKIGRAASDSAKMIAGMSQAVVAAQKPLDQLAVGMSAAGKEATAAGRLITGMGASGREAMEKLATTTKPTAGAFDSLKGAVGGVNKVLGAFGIALSASAVVGFVKGIGDFASEMINLNAETQISTSRLQAFNYVGAGVDMTIGSIVQNAEQLAKRLGGNDESVNAALAKLNLSGHDLKGLQLDEVIFQIDEAMKGVSNQMERTAMLTDLFGKSGAQMGRMMTGSLRETVKAAEESSAVIDEKLLRKAEQFDSYWHQAWIKFKAYAIDAVGAVGAAMQTNFMSDRPAFGMGSSTFGGVQFGPTAANFRPQYGPTSQSFIGANMGGSNVVVGGGLPSSDDPKMVQARGWAEAMAASEIGAWRQQMERDLKISLDIIEMSFSSATQKLAQLAMRAIPGVLPNMSNSYGLTGLGMFGPADISGSRGTGTIAQAAGRARQMLPLGMSLRMGFQGFGADLSHTVMGALMGGGNVAQSIGGLVGGNLSSSIMGSTVGKAISGGITKIFGSTVGGALNAFLPGIGTLLGPLMGKALGGVGKLFGIGREGAKTNDARDAKLMEFTGASSLREAQDTFRKMATDAGLTDAEIRKVFDTKKVKDFEAAAESAFDKIRKFQDEDAADAARLTAAIEKYGFAFEELGPAFRQQELHKQAKELIEDWRVLADSGIDLDLVNSRMAQSVNEYLQMAVKTGAEVPSAMRPVLESMLKQGVLTDAAGNAITDFETAGIKFSETMTEGFDRVVQKLDELIAKLGLAGDAIADLPSVPTTIPMPESVPLPPGVETSFANEGMVSRPTRAIIGDASEPEFVLHRSTVRSLAAGGNRQMLSELRAVNANISRLMRVIPDAVRDAVLLTR